MKNETVDSRLDAIKDSFGKLIADMRQIHQEERLRVLDEDVKFTEKMNAALKDIRGVASARAAEIVTLKEQISNLNSQIIKQNETIDRQKKENKALLEANA